MKLQLLFTDMIYVASFLSRLPFFKLNKWQLASQDIESRDFNQTAWAIPLAGFIVALPAACIMLGAHLAGANSSVASAIAVATLIISTGALHEDGLADLADGLGGGKDKETKLAIMRDSSIGSYGTLALIISVGLHWICLSQLIASTTIWHAFLSFCLIAGLSRGATLWPWVHSPSARTNSLSDILGAPDKQQLQKSAPTMLLMAFGLILLNPNPINLIIAALLFCGVTFEITRQCERQIGGRTGDSLGATQQLAAIALLVGITLG